MGGQHHMLMQSGKQGFTVLGKAGEGICIKHKRLAAGQCRQHQCAGALPDTQSGAQTQRVFAAVSEQSFQSPGICNRGQHDRVQLRGVFTQCLRRTGQGNGPCPDPQRRPCRQPASTAMAAAASQYQGMAVLIFMRQIGLAEALRIAAGMNCLPSTGTCGHKPVIRLELGDAKIDDRQNRERLV